MPTPTIFEGINPRGTQTLIPCKDAKAQNGVIANTQLIKDTVGWSGKNKWDKSKETGIDATITQTSDGFRAQVSSHAWGSARCDFATPAKNTDFILSCKANVTTAGNFMKMQVYGSMDGSDYSTSIAVTDTYSATKELELAFNSGNYNYLRITLYLTNGTAASADVTFEKPMLRDASILDDTYEPYFGSTAFPRSEQAVLGAKNVIKNNLASSSTANVEVVVNSDKSVSMSNTANADVWLTVYSDLNFLSKGHWHLNGCPSNGGAEKYFLCFIVRNADNTANETAYYDYGDGVDFDITDTNINRSIRIYIYVKSGQATNFTYYPMISLDGGSYVAPAMTNKELTEKQILTAYIEDTTTASSNLVTTLDVAKYEILCAYGASLLAMPYFYFDSGQGKNFWCFHVTDNALQNVASTNVKIYYSYIKK